MKYFLFLILLYGSNSFSQTVIDTAISFTQHDRTYVINKDSILSVYTDSINNTVAVNCLPNFLFEKCFEYNLPIVKGFHSTEDLRWEIINQVTNKEALKIILSSKDNRIKKVCEKYKPSKSGKVNKPYQQDSFYDLIRLKYKTFL